MNTAPAYLDHKLESFLSMQKFCEGETPYPAYPANLYLETSNLCDMKCAMCGPFSSMNPSRLYALKREERGFMSSENAMGWGDLLSHALHAQVFGYGEPTLNPDFINFLKLCGKYETVTSFFTNAMHFTDELVEAFVENRVFEITISASGIGGDYESIYHGGNWEKLISNIARLNEMKIRHHSRLPIISINSLGYHHHIDRLEEFCRVMAEVGVSNIDLKPLRAIGALPMLAHHVSIPRPWVEGVILERAKKLAASLDVELKPQLFEATAVKDEEEYARARDTMFKNFNADPAAPVIPIEAFKTLGIEPVHPPRDAKQSQVFTKGNRPYEGRIPAAELGAEGLYCFEPFYTLYIGRNMLVKPCCNTVFPTEMGKMSIDTGTDIWRGEEFNTMRETVVSGHYPNLCRNCIKYGTAHPTHHFLDAVYNYQNWLNRAFGVDLYTLPRWTAAIEAIRAAGNNQDIARRQSAAISGHPADQVNRSRA